jgi:hypothetical protein
VTGWRELLPVHRAANAVPRMTAAERNDVFSDIKKHGLFERVKIWRDDNGQYSVLDGIHRLDALEAIPTEKERLLDEIHILTHPDGGGTPRLSIFEIVASDIDPVTYVVSQNIHRRQLTVTHEQKRDLIAKVLEANPEKSDRHLAKAVGVDHKTLAAVRREKEARGEIPHVETRTDTKGRHQPATRAKATASAAPVSNAPPAPAEGREDHLQKVAAPTLNGQAPVPLTGTPKRDAKLITEHYGHDGLKLRELARLLDWRASRAFGRAARSKPDVEPEANDDVDDGVEEFHHHQAAALHE